MIPKGEVSLDDFRKEFGKGSGAISMDTGSIRFRANKPLTGPVDLNATRGTLATMLPVAATSYTSGSINRTYMEKVQIAKYDPANIVNAGSTFVRWNPSTETPHKGRMETVITRKNQNEDVAISQIYCGYVENITSGTFTLELYHSANQSTTGFMTNIEAYAHKTGWLAGTSDTLISQTRVAGGTNTFNFNANSTRPYVSIILHATCKEGAYWQTDYNSRTRSLRCTY